MLTDGLRIIEGAVITNLVMQSGSSFPSNPNVGELFYKTGADEGVYVYDTQNAWVPTAGASSSPATLTSGRIGVGDGNNELSDDADFLWNTTSNTLTLGSIVTPGTINSPATSNLTVKPGDVTSGTPGDLWLYGGHNTNAANTSGGGHVRINAGYTLNGPGGSVFINAQDGSGSGTGTGGGEIKLTAGAPGVNANPKYGWIAFNTGGTDRFRILTNGAWSVGNSDTQTGTAGQVLTSTGSTTPPTWQSVSGGGGSLTSTYIGYGDSSNLLTGGSELTYTASSGRFYFYPTNKVAPANSVFRAAGSTGATGASLEFYGGTGSSTGGYISFSTAPNSSVVERFRILSTGAWSVGSTGSAYGTSGQVLTSNGNSSPSWQTPATAVTNGYIAVGTGTGIAGSQYFTYNTTTGTWWVNTNNGTSSSITNSSSSTNTVALFGCGSSGSTAGGPVRIQGGGGSASLAGGAVTLQGGQGGTGIGGTVLVQGGTSFGSSAGAAATLQGGTAGPTGTGGAVNIYGGTGGTTSGAGGTITINGGTSTSGYGGSVNITGASATGTNNNGGAISIASGSNTGSGSGGYIRFMYGGQVGTERFRITPTGAWALGGSTNYGTSGQVLTSQGNAPPIWTTVSGGGGSATLTQNQIGIGDASNVLSGDADFTYTPSTGSFFVNTVTGLVSSVSTGAAERVSIFAGTSTNPGGQGADVRIVAGDATGGSGASGGNLRLTAGSGSGGGSGGRIILTLSNHLDINGSAGLSGQVLTSQGSGAAPIWAAPGSAGYVTNPMSADLDVSTYKIISNNAITFQTPTLNYIFKGDVYGNSPQIDSANLPLVLSNTSGTVYIKNTSTVTPSTLTCVNTSELQFKTGDTGVFSFLPPSEPSPVVLKNTGAMDIQSTGPLTHNGIELARKVDVPANGSSAGSPGDFAVDPQYLYVCVQANFWKRIILQAF